MCCDYFDLEAIMEDSKRYRFSYCRVISTVGVLFLLFATVYWGGEVWHFFDVMYAPVFIAVVGFAFFFLWERLVVTSFDLYRIHFEC